jgi:sugar-specific transcriptional regulator TrmB
MNTKLLEEIGLTQGETKVYLSLIKLGETKTGALAKQASVSSSKVYKILDRLITKGLVGHVTKGKIKYFSAMEPKRVLDYIDEKEKELQEKKELVKKMLPELELEQKMSGKKTEATIYEGFKAISNFYLNILDELKKGDEYYVIGAAYGPNDSTTRPFFQKYHTLRAKKGIKVNMLANHETRDNLVSATRTHSEVRLLPNYFVNNMTIVFYKNKAFLFILTKDPVGFLIKNEEVVKSFKTYFNILWNIAK